MVTPRLRLLALTAVLLFVSPSPVRLAVADPAKGSAKATGIPATLLKARVALAQKAYTIAADALRQSKKVDNRVILTGHPQDVYTWSVRWLQAQRALNPQHADQVAALQAHLKRMTELDREVRLLSKEGILLQDAEMNADWYRLEAEYWLAKAQTK